MATFKIPNDRGQVRQSNKGDVAGEIVASYNLDLTSSPGKIKTSKKLGRILSYTTDLNSSEIQDIVQENSNRFLVTDVDTYECLVEADPTDNANWEKETAVTDTFSNLTGFAVSFDGKTLISSDTDISSLTSSGGTYTSSYWQGTLSGASLNPVYDSHPMHVHRGGQETLCIADRDEIRYYNETAGHSVIALDDSVRANCFDSGVSAVWCGTYASKDEYAYVYEFYIGEQLDGTPVVRNAYKINARGVFSLVVHENTPYIITELGELMKFNGAGFTTVAQLPFASENKRLYGVRPSTIFASNSRPVHQHGMKVWGDSIYIHIKTNLETTDYRMANDKSPGGVWEYDINTGNLNHRFSYANSSSEYGETQIKKCGPIYLDSGDESFILVAAGSTADSNAGLFGLSDETPSGYFVTSEIESGSIQDTFERLVIKAKTMASGESIVVKYRSSKDPNYPQYNDITWTAATTFTTTDASYANVSVGDEVEVVRGYGSGHLAHVTVISEAGGTYTVTIDESVGSNTETASVRMDNWKKISETYDSTDGEHKIIGINKTAPWIQFKVSMTGNIELRRMIIKSNTKESA